MYQIAIGDDDALFLSHATAEIEARLTKNCLARGEDYHISTYEDPLALREALIAGGAHCDLLLLDIAYSGENGMKLAKALRKNHIDCSLVYITEHRDYVFDCFETHPLWYLLKPVDWDKLCEIILRDHRQRYLEAKLNLKLSGRQMLLSFSDIYALESYSHKVRIWFADKTMDWNGTLTALIEKIPPHIFCRCHNSFLVNLAHICEFAKSDVKMDNEAIFPVSRRFYASALQQYFAFLKQ